MEQDPYFSATENLMTLVSQGEKLGAQAKEVLLATLASELPELPNIKAYSSDPSFHRWKNIRALQIERGSLGKKFGEPINRHTIKSPFRKPLLAVTNEGIYHVPLIADWKSVDEYVYFADWEKREEIQPLEYLMLSGKVLEAIRMEREKQEQDIPTATSQG